MTTQAPRSAPWYRTMLFIPGHRLEWMLKAPRYGADALILDLEDSVPFDANTKDAARRAVADALDRLRGIQAGLFVRINGWGSGDLLKDLLAVVGPGIDGVILSKTERPAQVHALDLVLTEIERDRRMPVGSVEIVPLAETASGLHFAHDLCACSARVRRMPGVMAVLPGGDLERALGVESTHEGSEALFASSKVVLDARAAGVEHILSGTVLDINDLDRLRETCERGRRLGANGAMVVHPSHVPIVNEIFSPSRERIEEARATLFAMAAAIDEGAAAVRHANRMVDYAHVRSSLGLLRKAESIGLDVGDYPKIDVGYD